MSRIRTRRFIVIALVALGSGACRGGDTESAVPGNDTARADTSPADTPRPDTPAPARPPLVADDTMPPRAPDTTGAGLGRWDVTSLEKRLDLQGMAPRRVAAPVRHPFLAVDGTAYLVGNGELQVFLYENAAAAARDVAQLDTAAVAPRGQRVQWRAKPTLITNNNLVAIFLGQNALQIERVQRALMAGLPPT